MRPLALFIMILAVLPSWLVRAQNSRLNWSALDMGFQSSVGADVRITSVVGQSFVFTVGSSNTWVSGGFLVDTMLRGPVTSVDVLEELPKEFALYQNYPNPFNPSTTIRFAVPTQCQVTLVLHNILGQYVRTLMDEDMTPGMYSQRFEAKELSSGVYFYTMRAGQFVQTRRLIVIR